MHHHRWGNFKIQVGQRISELYGCAEAGFVSSLTLLLVRFVANLVWLGFEVS